MHSTYRITGNGLARALAGIAQSVAKPAKKVRDYSRQKRVMQTAWGKQRVWLAEHPNASARYRRTMFGHHLQAAHFAIFAQDNAHLFTVTSDEARFIGSDSRWR